jgi:SAM-dependent methyltransferase
LKRAVPLTWKEAYHAHKSLPQNALVRARNFLARRPPLPPAELIELVAGHRNPEWFLRGGLSASEAIRGMVARNGGGMAKMKAVLDFGCGVGRIMRHWKGIKGPRFCGTDYNPRLVEWCRNNLKFAEFRTNTLDGPLSYDPETFDLVYAFSVFTHLTEPLQRHWMGELRRILRPGGLLYLTAHGDFYLDKLNEEERRRFAAGELVVTDSERAGENVCAAYHPRAYVEGTLAEGFEVLEYSPRGARGDSDHDAYLLRKL